MNYFGLKYIKFSILIFVLSIVISCNHHKGENENIIYSKIDSLYTETDVENYIKKKEIFDREFELKTIQEFNRDYFSDSISKLIAKDLGIDKSFYKVDFDYNGHTDLLVIGDSKSCSNGKGSCSFDCFVLMSYPNDSIRIINLIKGAIDHSIVPVIRKTKENTFLEIHKPTKIIFKDVYKEGSIETLVYVFDTFIEYNSNPQKHIIQSLEFSAEPCFGTCPIFTMNINDKREAIFIAEAYNFSRKREDYREDGEGKFKTIVSTEKYNEIIGLLNYIDFKNLENEYFVNWTDDASVTLKIVYDNGKEKVINDYGLIGTYGLNHLYRLFFDLRFNQKWEEILEQSTTEN